MSDTRRIRAPALLLDMDGVLVESAESVDRHWTAWAERRGLPPAEVLAIGHGAPTREVIASFVPAEEVDTETEWLESLVFADPGHDRPLPGAQEALGQRHLPVAVGTSASHVVARHRLERAGLSKPHRLVTADDVARGKPDPEPYRLAAARLGVEARRCVAIEDSPAGVQSANEAGATTLAVLVSHSRTELGAAAAVIENLASVHVSPGGLRYRTVSIGPAEASP